MRRFLTLSAVSLLSFGVAACGDGPVDPTPEPSEGSISFTYSGAQSGSFSAQGNIRLDSNGDPVTDSFANAWADGERLMIAGMRVRSAERRDGIAFLFSGQPAPGSYPLDFMQCGSGQSQTPCSVGMIVLNVPIQGGDPTDGYIFVSGTMNLTRVSSTFVEGTFSGTALKMGETGTVAAIQVTAGRFSTPIIPNPAGSQGFALSPAAALQP
jgi:hypothetical protein